MSGDVQPRKRKDKRRRRDDDEGSAAQSVPLIRSGSSERSDSVTIHVHKEAGTGGHWCARIIFFALLAGLLGVVGLIILEHRGTGDVDTPVTASQWAMIFEGWVDEAPAQHDDEHEVADADEDEQLGESHEDEEHDDDDDDHSEHDEDDEDEEETPASEEENDDDAEECSKMDEDIEDHTLDKTISEEDTDEGLGDDDDNDDEENSNFDANDIDSRPDDKREADYTSAEKDNEDEDYMGNADDTDEDEGYTKEEFNDEPDDLGALEEVEDDDVNDTDETEDETAAAFDPDLDVSIEGIKAASNEEHGFLNFADEDDTAEDYISIPPVNDIDDNSTEPLEEIDGEEPEEIVSYIQNEEDEDEDKAEQILEEESTSVAMKFGVGVALIVTAHFVLVRRWNNGDADAPEILTDSDEVPNLSRRNTLVPPVRIKEMNLKDNKQATTLNKEQEQNYEDLRSTYKSVVSKDNKRPGIEEIFAKKTANLQMMLRGESEDKATKVVHVDNKNHQIVQEEYSEDENDYEDDGECDDEDMEEDYDDDEEVEDEEEDEEEEEEEEDDEGEEDIEELDDTKLVERLDKKYGKLPTPQYSDQENEEESEEEEKEEEDYEQDDELTGWKSVKAPIAADHKIVNKSKESKSKPKSGGQQGDDYFEDLSIIEETDSISYNRVHHIV